MKFFGVLLAVYLSANSALAGGGGCDSDCPPTPPDRAQVICRLVRIEQLDRAAAAISPKVQMLVEKMLDGFQLQLRGDETTIYATTLRVAGDTPDAKPKQIDFGHYRAPDSLQREPLAFDVVQYYKLVWSIGEKDPRPIVTDLNYQLRKAPGDTLARFKLLQYGMFSQQDPWKSQMQPLLEAALECRTE